MYVQNSGKLCQLNTYPQSSWMYERLLKGPGNSISVNNFQYMSVKSHDKNVLNNVIDEEYSRKFHSISQSVQCRSTLISLLKNKSNGIC